MNITDSFTFLKPLSPPEEAINIILEIYTQLGENESSELDSAEIRLKHQRCNNIILQFICLLFLNLEDIPSLNEKGFSSWCEVYNNYDNPGYVFRALEENSIPTSITSLFNIENQIKDDDLKGNRLKSIDWGNRADYLTKKFKWVRDYSESEGNLRDLVTLEIFDVITTHVKRQKVTFKKIKGVIYTPYRLATHIAEEALIHWLTNSFPYLKQIKSLSEACQIISGLEGNSKSLFLKKIESIRILDFATGTSVFLIAVANHLFDTLKGLNSDITSENLKYQILERNLFGIDIDPFAIKISIIKFWLWTFHQKNSNLYKSVAFKSNFYEGNTLFGFQSLLTENRENDQANLVLERQMGLLDSQFDQQIFDQFPLYEVSISHKTTRGLEKLFKISQKLTEHHSFKYFILEGDRALWNYEKNSLNKNILHNIRFSALNSRSSAFKLYVLFSSPLDMQEEETITDSILKLKKYSIPQKFHWSHFRSFFPLKFDLIIGNPPFIALTDLSMISRKILQITYPSIYTGNNDLSYFFIVRALSALQADNGILSLILPKYVLHNVYARKIRDFITRSAKILEIDDFAELSLFRKTGIKNIVLHLKRDSSPSNHLFEYKKYRKTDSQVKRATYRLHQLDLKPEKWILLDPPKLNLLNHIKKISNTMLKDVAYISKGIETGCDQVFAPKEPFYLSKVLKINQNQIRPWIKGKDIKQFLIANSGREVLYAPSYRKHEIIANKKIMNYLEQNKAKLLNRSRVVDFYLWRSGDERKTMKWNFPKVITPYKAKQNTFAIDMKGCLSSKDVVWIIPKENFPDKDFLLFLVAILNSEVLTFFAQNSIKDLGGLYEYYPNQIQNFPLVVPKTNTTEYKSICELSSKLIGECDKEQKRKNQKKLNNIIFGIYGLSQEDIDLIKS